MKRLAAAGGILAACSAGAAEGAIWHVSSSGGNQDGLSWPTAFTSLQSALAKASAGDQIWVAAGTYSPDPADRDVSFELKKEVAVYGGFSGTEAALEQRDWIANTTVLSGDIGNGDKTKNTVTIVKGADGAVLDGFTISGAYSTGQSRMHLLPSDISKNDMAVGGGMRNFKVSPVVRNCVFTGNYSPKGGAVYNVQDASASQARFENVIFSGNTAQMRGGAVSNDLGAMPVFINCQFLDNTSLDKGGALYDDFAASPILLNCLFRGNRAVSAAAIGNDGGSSPLLVNVTIEGNHASGGLGDGLYQGTGANNDPIMINSSTDNIYNWHEDVVAVLNSKAPAGFTVPLAAFILQSSLNGRLSAADLAQMPATPVGYQSGFDGSLLAENPLVANLLAIYAADGGAIRYQGEYVRPAASATGDGLATVYVAPSGKAGDGSSWDRAMTDLQTAIDKASQNKAAVWIREGTYAPAAADASRIAAFTLYDGVKLYGGFAGTETRLEDRDPAAHPVILTAKAGDGSVYSHVVYAANDVVLDGLTIRDGMAVGFTYNGKGGGLLAYHAGKTYAPLGNYASTGFTSITINNCRFVANRALEGGAIYAFSKASLTVSNTEFKDNYANYGGAVMSREGNVFTYENCVFEGNSAAIDGGAVYEDYGSHAEYKGCLFRGNTAKAHGGAAYVISRASQLGATEVKFEKCLFTRNLASDGANLFNLDASEVSISETNLDASGASYIEVGAGVKYRLIGEYGIERLNKILTTEAAAFSGFPVAYPAAVNPVRLYEVIYPTAVPEDGNRQTVVSGLVAVPVADAKVLPMVSYQHGTVFSRYEVPSNIEDSMETKLAVALFGGHGYVVVAADYIGKGVSGEPDGWMVPGVTVQACVDMLAAAKAVCANLGVNPGKLFLSGWSQGAYSTAAFMRRLEECGTPVAAAAMASTPNDIYLCINRWINVPSELDVDWLVGAAALMINSYETYYKLPGLAASAIRPEYLDAARDLYNNRLTWQEASAKLPSKVRELLRDDFIEQGALVENGFFRRLEENSVYRWRFKTPTLYYYGAIDEVVTPYMVQLPVEYQKTLGGAPCAAVFAGEKANHRGTFMFGLLDQKKRFDAILSDKK